MEKPSLSAAAMSELIKKAMEDGKITNAEFNQIMMIADEDYIHDAQEKKLLSELHDMIENGTIERVAG
jgi:hypothetical protein